MNVAFIVLDTALDIYGVRLLSAILKQHGHSVSLFFPVRTSDSFEDKFLNIDKQKLQSLVSHLDGIDVACLSFTTYFLKQAYYYSQYINKMKGIPVIWGGAHATATPEGAIAHNDIVCSGEGEICLTMFLASLENTRDIPTNIEGIWVRKNNRIFRNGLPQQVIDMDTLPYPDYSLDNNFVWIDGGFTVLKDDLLDSIYSLITRGCVFRCTYCSHNKHNLYGKMMRRHSVQYIIDEVTYFTTRFPNLKAPIGFADSDFFLLPKTYLIDFISEYKEMINRQFYFSCSPATWKTDKAKLLLDTGLVQSI